MREMMEFISHKKDRILFFFILLLGVFLIFFRITRADFLSDDAHYAYRSLDFIDYVSSQNQTTPLQWFGKIPGWSRLSFHDAPPVFFIIQHTFFKLFGGSVFVARLPSALAGVVSLILIFYISRTLYSPGVAVLAMLFLAVNPFFIWGSRIGYLESIELTFILASLYFFLRSASKPRFLYFFGFFLGLAFLTKYTSFFLIPLFITYVFLQRRDVLKEHRDKFILSLLIIFVLFVPVIIYNVMVFKTRGHFDMQFSILFNQSMTDWPIINRAIETDFFKSPFIFTQIKVLIDTTTLLVTLVFIVSFLFLLYEQVIRNIRHDVVLLSLIFLSLFFALINPTIRYLPLVTPFMALAMGYLVHRLLGFLKENALLQKNKIFFALGIVCVSLFVGYQIFVTVNTNHLYKPVGRVDMAYLSIRVENLGFKQLDEYLGKLFKDARPTLPALPEGYQLLQEKIAQVVARATDQDRRVFSPLVIYDENLNWFARMWVFEKRLKLQYFPIYSFENTITQGSRSRATYLERGVDSAYIILPAGENLSYQQGKRPYVDRAAVLRRYVDEQGIQPVEVIRGFSHEERFYVYFIDHVWETFDKVFVEKERI